MNTKYIIGLGEALWDMLPQGKKIGGAPANFAFHASQFGLPTKVVSAVGNDTLGDELISAFQKKHLNLNINRVDYPTGTPASNVLWILLYTIAGIGIPLAGIALYRHFSPQVHITEHQLINILRFLVRGTVSIVLAIGLGIAHFFQYLWRSFLQMIKEISDASSTKDE